ncbi:MAG: hypothetical protein U0903_19805 [Planctomycetales bacterium]
MILNALSWTAKVDIPEQGVESTHATHAQVTAASRRRGGDRPRHARHPPHQGPPLFAGNTAHKWHNWEKTTPATKSLLEPRLSHRRRCLLRH